ncbi:hypothetical protein [Francisella tularensis]
MSLVAIFPAYLFGLICDCVDVFSVIDYLAMSDAELMCFFYEFFGKKK